MNPRLLNRRNTVQVQDDERVRAAMAAAAAQETPGVVQRLRVH
jgi:hypothetical protein